jgi:hypothetical protein
MDYIPNDFNMISDRQFNDKSTPDGVLVNTSVATTIISGGDIHDPVALANSSGAIAAWWASRGCVAEGIANKDTLEAIQATAAASAMARYAREVNQYANENAAASMSASPACATLMLQNAAAANAQSWEADIIASKRSAEAESSAHNTLAAIHIAKATAAAERRGAQMHNAELRAARVSSAPPIPPARVIKQVNAVRVPPRSSSALRRDALGRAAAAHRALLTGYPGSNRNSRLC